MTSPDRARPQPLNAGSPGPGGSSVDVGSAPPMVGAAPASPDGPRVDDDGVLVFEGRALGSPLRLFVDAAGIAGGGADAHGWAERAASRAWAIVRDEFAEVDRALSRFRDDSELTALNRRAGDGGVVEVSWRLRTALAGMDRARRITGGRFEPSVLGDLERLGEHGADLAGAASRAARATATTARTDAPSSRRLERPSRVHVPGAALDSGGIGKGLALRWALARASAVDPRASLLLDAGGDVVAGGRLRAGGWRIGVEDPLDPGGAPVAVANVDRGAIATSSVGVRSWTAPDGRRVHHLLDPRTGEPARTGLIAVTVAGPDPAWAEVWTKALFLSGRTRIGDEARARGLAAWWLDDAGRLGMTPAARVRSDWVAEARLG